MSGSRKSLKNVAVFNPRASNEWSKDESKFGQRLLEKMGWKHGQGIGLNNQGITENIKVPLKLDNKGLGYQIKEDQWLEVRSEFSDLLSQLSQSVEGEDETLIKGKKSLEAVSQSSKTRVHYHKFTHGKDIARYKKEDLIGILGKKGNKEESIVSENKEFIHSGNMDEYFKSKKNKSKGSNWDFSSEKNLCLNTEPVQENSINLQDVNPNSNSRKRKKSMKSSSNDNENEILNENKSVDENSKVQNTENYKDEELHGRKSNSNSRKRKTSEKTWSNDIENEKSSENKSVEENSIVQSIENTKDEELDDRKSNSMRKRRKSVKTRINDNENEKSSENKSVNENSIIQSIESIKDEEVADTDHIGRKKMRNSDLSSEVTHQKIDFDIESVHENDTNNSKDCYSSQVRKKSSKKLQNENKIEELGKNELVDEKVLHQQIEETKIDVLNLPPKKKKRDKYNTSPSHVEFEPKLTNDNAVVENNDINLQVESLTRKKKKKSAKKSNEALMEIGIEKNENKHEGEEGNKHHEDKTGRKKEENSLNTDSKSSETSIPLEVIDSSCKFKKRKPKSKKLTDTCSYMEKNTKVLDTLDRTSEDFMKSVIDYNSSNNVEEYISNFEKNRDELMNKYRERYKMKYLMSSSDQIQVFGDEFDGRKLDCKKPNSEEVCVMKTVDRKNMSKAEKIIAKARLLKSIKDSTITHNFEGSNLTNILGYGSEIC